MSFLHLLVSVRRDRTTIYTTFQMGESRSWSPIAFSFQEEAFVVLRPYFDYFVCEAFEAVQGTEIEFCKKNKRN